MIRVVCFVLALVGLSLFAQSAEAECFGGGGFVAGVDRNFNGIDDRLEFRTLRARGFRSFSFIDRNFNGIDDRDEFFVGRSRFVRGSLFRSFFLGFGF